MNSIGIFPSLISANILSLEKTIQSLDQHCAGFHIDIMDNHFVPNLTFGPLFANAIDQLSTKPSWVHLMVKKPEAMIPQLKLKANSIISFHLESTRIITKIIKLISHQGWIASLAIKPYTPLSDLYPYLPMVKHVLLMSVEPGFSGQPFIEESRDRLTQLATYRKENKLIFTIGMDGGINSNTIGPCATGGSTDFAIASGIFSSDNHIAAVKALYATAFQAQQRA